ncbi:hypothetical protein M422DRAFT_224736 [Sphaerobolus stellatus SS14]|nr:hypothetical protein M422DRAFT_224736 [Sphaerobolus stellatus SS14]
MSCEASDTTADLPPMTPMEEKKYGSMGVRMQYFHNYFKKEFDEIYELADGKFYERGMSLPIFLQTANEFRRHLEGHHHIEETYIFPVLAKKMPTFQDDDQHKTSHKKIHDGLDALAALITRFRQEPNTYSPVELRSCLDGFREPLMTHLDEEVHDLRAENMRKYWTLEEMSQIPM